MAVSIRVSSRYAKSLIELASSKNQLDIVKLDMESIIALWNESRDFVLFCNSPIISTEKKQKIVKQIFQNKVSELTLNFLSIVVSKGRENGLFDIAKAYIDKYNVEMGIETVQFYTAQEVGSSTKDLVKESLAKALNKKIVLKSSVKKDLIGGYVLRVGDKQLDNSVKTNLQRLKNEFIK